MPHPDLTHVTQGIQARYRGAQPGPRETYHEGEFGTYSRHLDDPSLDSVLIRPLSKDLLPNLLKPVDGYFGEKPVRMYVDDREVVGKLRACIENSGCRRYCELICLTHTGAPPDIDPVPGLAIELGTPENVRDYEVTRVKSFENSEDQPDESEVAANVVARTSDLGEGCQLLIGRIDGEAAAIAGWYEGIDRLIFHLATRVPFRHKGIARQLLSHIIAETYAQKRRSVTILTDPEDSPIHFYRRTGFTEEVYWQARYIYQPATLSAH